ncbi:MAG: M28 family peptidase [Flavobacteriales bacterium]
MKNWMLATALVALAGSFHAQLDSIAMKYAATITADELKQHLMVLAGDEYEGRETGMPGQKKAAQYITNHFKSLGIPPCVGNEYVQTFPLRSESVTGSTLTVNGERRDFLDGFLFFPGFSSGDVDVDALTFVGFGIEDEKYSDYDSADVKGKVLIAFEGEPVNADGTFLISGNKEASVWNADWREKRRIAEEKGAAGLILIKGEFDRYVGRVKYWLQSPGMRLDYPMKRGEEVLPTYFVSEGLAAEILTKGKVSKLMKMLDKLAKKPDTREVKVDLQIAVDRSRQNYTGENVLAFIEGTDPVLKDEIVVVTAHYDHIGIVKGEINNGADDDGSGTVSALEIAEAFAKAKSEGHGPRRSVLVMTVSGEEKGLLGSEWYSEYPVFPLEQTVCDLNIDMIGRIDEAHANDERYVYLIGSDKLSTQLHSVSEACNSNYTQLALDYTYNDPKDPNRFYYRSDHYNFAKHGIPVIFYFSGVHEDYHKPGDDPEKIMYDKTAEIAQLVFHTAWEVANRDERLPVDVENEFTD